MYNPKDGSRGGDSEQGMCDMDEGKAGVEVPGGGRQRGHKANGMLLRTHTRSCPRFAESSGPSWAS